ncbi:hypothetical protein DOY81_004766 [Sarcophaga bullata]|nr:hypothetical protein DOY81_004766 [Sarcophaga bullata]
MNGNSSIERRYSFNLAQSNPIAESTHLGSSFSWGTSWSPRARSNSSISLNNTNPSAGCNNRINICSSPKIRNVTKIDARIAADVQSKGLASRIVKYHESGTRLNRSMSAHNLYSKPGQFPVVTLKRTELPFRATKKELSMIHIPPPEKSTFYGNTISSLLRSNSVVGIQSKRTEENRPIIHPPPTENDMAPTRSVLDVLKEISRKRINSDSLEADETSKKYCNRVNDLMDPGMCAASTNAVVNNTPSTNQRLKRQRDCIISHQSVHTSEVKTSPEQAKKRVCNYNNDITSSLSSSNKNRWNEKRRASHSLNHIIAENSEFYETQKAKMQCIHDYPNNTQTTIRFEKIANNLRKAETVKPISPIPKTPCVQDEDVIPQKSTSEPLYNSNGNVPVSSKPDVSKPKLTLFNKKYEEVEGEKYLESSSSTNTDELSSCDECAGIPFVKPKNISISGLKNPLIERTQKSKLALMLSGLRGELYRNSDADNVDSPKEKEEKSNGNKLNLHAITASTTVSPVTVTLTTVTPSSNSNTKTSTTISLSTNTSTNTEQTNTSVAKTSSPLVGLKLSHAKPHSENDINDIKSTDATPITKVPVLGGFTFSTTTTSMSAVVPTTSTSKGLTNSTSTTTSPISLANSLVTFNQPTSSNTSISLNLPPPKDKPLPLPIVSTNSICTNANTAVNTVNSFKLPNSLTLEKNITSSITAVNNNTVKPFNFSVSAQPSTSATTCSSAVTFQPLPASTISTTTISTANNVPFGTVTTTSNISNITPTTAAFSFNQTKTSVPGLVSTTPMGKASTSAFTFGPNPSITSVSTLGVNNNQGVSGQASSSPFQFDSQSKSQNLVSDDKNNSTPSQKSSNLFNSNSPILFGTPSLNAPTTVAAFGSSTNSSENNIFGATSAASTSVFGSSSTNNNKQIFGSNSESKPSVFGEGITKNNSSATFSFGSKPLTTQNVNNNSSTTGGFSFGSSFSKTSDGGMFGFDNTTKSTTTANTSSNVFGNVPATTLENKSFVFGSNSDKTENVSGNLFGATSNKTSETLMAPGGFSFNSTAVQKPSTFSFGTTGNAFSSSNVSNSNSTSGFSFGGTSSKPGETTNNKTFSFGTPQPKAQQPSIPVSNNNLVSSNIFGSTGPSKPAPPPAFNFNSGSSTGLQSIGQQTSNIFAPPPSNITTGPEKRQIRRATRRLQK